MRVVQTLFSALIRARWRFNNGGTEFHDNLNQSRSMFLYGPHAMRAAARPRRSHSHPALSSLAVTSAEPSTPPRRSLLNSIIRFMVWSSVIGTLAVPVLLIGCVQQPDLRLVSVHARRDRVREDDPPPVFSTPDAPPASSPPTAEAGPSRWQRLRAMTARPEMASGAALRLNMVVLAFDEVKPEPSPVSNAPAVDPDGYRRMTLDLGRLTEGRGGADRRSAAALDHHWRRQRLGPHRVRGDCAIRHRQRRPGSDRGIPHRCVRRARAGARDRSVPSPTGAAGRPCAHPLRLWTEHFGVATSAGERSRWWPTQPRVSATERRDRQRRPVAPRLDRLVDREPLQAMRDDRAGDAMTDRQFGRRSTFGNQPRPAAFACRARQLAIRMAAISAAPGIGHPELARRPPDRRHAARRRHRLRDRHVLRQRHEDGRPRARPAMGGERGLSRARQSARARTDVGATYNELRTTCKARADKVQLSRAMRDELEHFVNIRVGEVHVERHVEFIDCLMTTMPGRFCQAEHRAHLVDAIRTYFRLRMRVREEWAMMRNNPFSASGVGLVRRPGSDGISARYPSERTDPRIVAGLTSADRRRLPHARRSRRRHVQPHAGRLEEAAQGRRTQEKELRMSFDLTRGWSDSAFTPTRALRSRIVHWRRGHRRDVDLWIVRALAQA